MSQQQNSTISGSIYDVYTDKDTRYKEQRMPRIGQVCKYEDGREFVFCAASQDVVAGKFVAAPTPFAGTLVTAVNKGDTELTVEVVPDVAAGELAGGYLSIGSTNYKIKANSAASAGSNSKIILYDGVTAAFSATAEIKLAPERHTNCATLASDVRAVGVVMVSTNKGSASRVFFWAQTRGVYCGAVVTGGDVSKGDTLGVNGGDLANTSDIVAVATALVNIDDGKTGFVYIEL